MSALCYNNTATSEIYTLSLHDALPILTYLGLNHSDSTIVMRLPREKIIFLVDLIPVGTLPGRGMIDFYPLEAESSIKDRKSTRLNSSHLGISYAVFCLKKKT